MTDDTKSPGQQAKEQQQRAARYEKLDRNERGPHPSGASYAEKAKDARHAEGLFRHVGRLLGK